MNLHKSAIIVLVLMVQACSSGPVLTPQQAMEQSFETMRQAAREHIADESRVKRFVAHSLSLQTLLVDYNRAFIRFASELSELNADYRTPRSELEAALNAFTAKRKATMQQAVEIHFDMVGVTMADEWDKIVEHEIKAFEFMGQMPETGMGTES